jgi:hypothetical protein
MNGVVAAPDVASLTWRRANQQMHPMLLFEGYTLQTSTLEAVEAIICSWLELGKSGLAFGGLTRAGKSMVIKALMQRLEKLFPDVAFVFLTAEVLMRWRGADSVFGDYLSQLKVGPLRRGQLKPFDVLANYLMTRCIDRGGTCCVLFLDEAQKFMAPHWLAMGILWNRLAYNGYRTCVYSFGNEELHGKADIHKYSTLAGVAGRFLVKNLDFDGVRTFRELASILRQYDEALCHPDAGWPYTRFFAQEAFDFEGFRLYNQVKPFWAALCDYAGQKRLSGPSRGFSMQWVTDPVHYILKECLNTHVCPDDKGRVPWAEAIEATCPATIC